MPPQQGDIFDRLSQQTPSGVHAPDVFDRLGSSSVAKAATQAPAKRDVFDMLEHSPSPAAKPQSGDISMSQPPVKGLNNSLQPGFAAAEAVQGQQPAPSTPSGSFLTRGLVPSKYLTPLKPEAEAAHKQKLAEAIASGNPSEAYKQQMITGVNQSIANTFSGLTSPLSVGTLALGPVLEAGGKAGAVASKAIAAGFTGSSLYGAAKAYLDPKLSAAQKWEEGLQDTAFGLLGMTGLAHGPKPSADIADTSTPTTSPDVPTQKVPIEVAPPVEAQPAPVEVPISQGPSKVGAGDGPRMTREGWSRLTSQIPEETAEEARARRYKDAQLRRSQAEAKAASNAPAPAKVNPPQYVYRGGGVDIGGVHYDQASSDINEARSYAQKNNAPLQQIDLTKLPKDSYDVSGGIGTPNLYRFKTAVPPEAIQEIEPKPTLHDVGNVLAGAGQPTSKMNEPPDPLDEAIKGIPDDKLQEFQQTLTNRAKELHDNAALTRQRVAESQKNEANAKTAIAMKATGRPAQPLTTTGPSGEKAYVLDENGKAQWSKEESEVDVHGRMLFAHAEGRTPRFSDEDLQSDKFDRAKPAKIPQDAWNKAISLQKTKYFADRAKILKDVEIANDTQQPIEDTDIPARIKDLSATGKGIWNLPKNSGERVGTLKQPPLAEDTKAPPLWTMDKKTADSLTGRNNRTIPSNDELLAHADKQDAKAANHLALADHIQKRLAAPKAPVTPPISHEQQAVEAAGAIYKSTWPGGPTEAVLPRSMTENLPIDPRHKDFVSITIDPDNLNTDYIQKAMAQKVADIQAGAARNRARELAAAQQQQAQQAQAAQPPPDPNAEAAAAQARIEANTATIARLVDTNNINSPTDVDASITNLADHLEHNEDPNIVTPQNAEARTRLANSLGMAEKDIFGEKSGQGHSAAEITAAQMIVDKSRENTFNAMAAARAAGTGTPEETAAFAALAKHNEIVEGVRDKFAKEAGRALQAVQKTTPFDQAVSAWSKMDPAAKAETARRLTLLDPKDPGQMERFARDLKPTMKRSQVFEAWQNFLLSGAAALTKTSSDVAMLLTSLPEKVVNGITDAIGATLTGRERQEFAGEALAQAHGFLDGAKAGFDQFLKTYRTETSPDFIDNEFTKFDHAIKGRLGRTIRIPMRTLAAITDGFKVINYSGRIRATAWREAVKSGLNPFSDEGNRYINKRALNPTLEMRNEANNFSNQQVLQEKYDGPGLYNETMRALIKLRRDSSIAKGVFPFIKTPGNVAREAARFTPAGFYGTVKDAILDRSRLNQANTTLEASKELLRRNPGEKFYAQKVKEATQNIKDIQQRAFDRRSNLSKNILGTGAFLWAIDQALKGNITGAGPQNPQARKQLIATGWQPYSVKFGNTYIQYRRSPQAFAVLGSAGDIAETMKENPAHVNLSKRLISGVHKAVALGTDITFLNSISSISHLLEGHENVAQTASYETIPTGVRNVAHIIDSRVTDPQNAAQQFEAQIPFLSKRVPSRTDVTGQPETLLKKNLGGFNPFPVSKAKENTGLVEQMRLEANRPTTPHVTGKRMGGEKRAPKITITPDEQKALAVQDAQIENQRINAFVRHPGYAQLSDEQKRLGIEHIKRQTQLSRIYRLMQLREAQGKKTH